ncbi:MAG: TrmB family transcriptional regulator [Crenarchaeota archaeon]|nr:MAG: TrmB family transcriptional regulator [Thermoproteota archaeon]RDJ34359.1 MAG: TrmB family transcriptional regulator [Thermoproteota archaeon]RDJ37179.1 MAG: TrmB family transcriptional regulator [Thermoproteota archaeon]RDJ37940.1 MAG: TrmB family transcriptional regulator [Thermoproteota archaeon]
MSTESNLATELSYFGLDETDSKMYLGLLRIGSLTVGKISTKLEIDRGKAYRSLNKLRDMGLITTTFSNPTICEAVAPSDALTSVIQRKEDEVTTMQKLSRKIIAELKELKRPEEISEVSSISIVQGRSNIYSRIGKMIQESSKTIYIMTTAEDVLRMYHTAIPEKIKLCKKNGGTVKVLTYAESDNIIPLIDRLGAQETRIGKLPSKSRVIVEEKGQLIMSGSIKETMDLNEDTDSILYTNSAEMINNMHSLCQHLWKKAKPLKVLNA